MTKINPQEWYSLNSLTTKSMFPWASSYNTIKKIVLNDVKGKNILKPVINGAGSGTKYRFKGSNIINFIQAVENGKTRLQ